MRTFAHLYVSSILVGCLAVLSSGGLIPAQARTLDDDAAKPVAPSTDSQKDAKSTGPTGNAVSGLTDRERMLLDRVEQLERRVAELEATHRPASVLASSPETNSASPAPIAASAAESSSGTPAPTNNSNANGYAPAVATIEVSSVHSPGARRNGPPPIMSAIFAKEPGEQNSRVVPRASPTASPSRLPRNRSMRLTVRARAKSYFAPHSLYSLVIVGPMDRFHAKIITPLNLSGTTY
jgi:hypothetical protein